MDGLGELYQQLIIDHNRHPRNFGSLEDATETASGDNPLCGDRITLYLRVKDDVIEEIRFEGSGCAISQASASLMTTAVRGKKAAEALELVRALHAMVTGPQDAPAEVRRLGKLAAFAGVRAFPARVKCANLPWPALRAGLNGNGRQVSTEYRTTGGRRHGLLGFGGKRNGRGVKHGNLQQAQCGHGRTLAKISLQLASDAQFECVSLFESGSQARQQVEGDLGAERFARHLLKAEQVDRLFLKLVNGARPHFRSRAEDLRHRVAHREACGQARQQCADHDGRRVRCSSHLERLARA